MATVYKRTRRKAIPRGAEIIEYRGKRYAVWTSRGGRKRKASLTDDGQAVLIEDDHYTVEWWTWDGKRRRLSGGPDKDAAESLGAAKDTEEMRRRSGLIDPRQERLAQEGRRSLDDPLTDYEAKLRAANRDPKHIATTLAYIRAIAEAAGFTTAGDMSADGVNAYAADLGEKRSARTVQAHLTAIKGFSKWLAEHGKLPSDPLASVKRPDPKSARKRERRMLLPEEWDWLRAVTLADGVERFGMESQERVLLYTAAIQTGLRSGELRSLTRGRLYLDVAPPFITCKAGSTKNKKDCRQYIQETLAAELLEHVGRKAPGAPVFAMPHKFDVATMLRADLDAARRAWLKAADNNPQERIRREQSDFLVTMNHESEALDFHALRHTCGAWLAMSGAHPKAVQAVMRHSTITLTMDTYGHLFPGQEAETVARLPEMLRDGPEALQATGTCDAIVIAPTNGAAVGAAVDRRKVTDLARDGESRRSETAAQGEESDVSQVVPLSVHKKSRRVIATAGFKAEGTGVEPATGCPAPDFESGHDWPDPRSQRPPAVCSNV